MYGRDLNNTHQYISVVAPSNKRTTCVTAASTTTTSTAGANSVPHDVSLVCRRTFTISDHRQVNIAEDTANSAICEHISIENKISIISTSDILFGIERCNNTTKTIQSIVTQAPPPQRLGA